VVTVHDLIHLRFPEHRTRLERLYARTMLRRAVRRAARVLAVSATTARELESELGIAAESVVVAPNGVDDAFRTDADPVEDEAFRRRHDLAAGYLLFVGNPKPHKNLDRLLAAYSALRRRRPQAPPLVLAGDRLGERSGLPAAIEAAGLGEAVRTLGHLPADELPALYRGAAILVQPSLWEGFGLPVAEAMAAGTPVIAARRGALPEVAGEAARLVDPESVEEIAAAIEALLDDPAERLRLARAGRARAEGFRWEECARRVLATYEEVLAESRGARP
ncbi:MAG TPA: glycosyltransferase family 1 protein, partial [Thermoanaerobaculia bacterium]|nr:glycosyltransferase family 1 protein [Thermoanaerobaculia bacterium]